MDLLTDQRFLERKQAVERVLEARSIEYFEPWELYQHDNPAWPWDPAYPPPTRMAPHIGPAIEIGDRLRETWGGAVEIVSGFRVPPYNDLLRTADNEHAAAEDSEHQYFRALDLRPVEPRSDDYSAWIAHCEEVIHKVRSEGIIVGFGRYDTFVHIDSGYYSYNRNWHPRRE